MLVLKTYRPTTTARSRLTGDRHDDRLGRAFVALLGPNGAGKTTLLKAIAGMLPFDRGEVCLGDIVFQNVSLLGCHPADVSDVALRWYRTPTVFSRAHHRGKSASRHLRASAGAGERLDMVLAISPS